MSETMPHVKAVHVNAFGKPTEVTLTDLADYQRLVYGYIEPIRLPVGITMYVNEEGNLNNATLNIPVSYMLMAMGVMDLWKLPIRGDVIFTGPVDRDGWDTDLPETWRQTFLNIFLFRDQPDD